jgi:mutator protein MutT
MEPITIALALIWKEGRLLISRRRADQHLGGLWEFPGGKCEADESPEQCAVREALEEVGIVCRAVSTLNTILHQYPSRVVELIPVVCEHLSGDGANLMVDEHRWVTPDELSRFSFPEANAALIANLTGGDVGRQGVD